MIQNGYSSRSIPSFKVFEDVYNERIAAKRAGNKELANTLKLVLNTTYGATLAKTNPLYDPLHARSVCISGQLYLLELAEHLYRDIPGLQIPELNTDGIEVEFDDRYVEQVQAIVHEWEERTHFQMEEEIIDRVVSKDVNNYVQIIEGKVKTKGGMLVRGIAPAGAFNVNNNMVIVAEALRDYLAHGIPPEKTIGDCNELLKFQMVAKASHKYSHVYQIVNGERLEVQRCNRVYAGKDPAYGTLIKVHAERGNDNKISGLPEHCFIDNKNTGNIEDIDKQWYIDLCWSQIQAFMGYDPREERVVDMAEKKTMNVYQKLLEARIKFMDAAVQKTGKNMHLSYKYFELDDIVPIANRIFKELGLLPLVTFDATAATMNVVNVDAPEEFIPFSSPMKEIEPIMNKMGGEVTNSMQRLGAVETYQRRYLYMVALDITEPDEMERNAGAVVQSTPRPAEKPVEPAPQTEATAPKAAKPIARKAPITTEERKEITAEVTNADGQANGLQIEQLKKTFAAVIKKDPGKTPLITEIMTKTKGLAEISGADCEKYLKVFGQMI